MTEDDHVHAHRFDVAGRVDEGFAFADAGAFFGEVDHVGAEARSGQGEAGARPRAVLEECVDDDAAAEGRDFLDASGGNLPETLWRSRE